MSFESEYFVTYENLFTAKQRVNILMRIVQGLLKEVLELSESYKGALEEMRDIPYS